MSYATPIAQPSWGLTLAEANQADKFSIFSKKWGTAAMIAGAIGNIGYAAMPLQPPIETPKWLANSGGSTSSLTWDNLLNLSHPATMSPEVKKFERSMFHTDMEAVRDIYDIVLSNFHDVPEVSLDYSMDISYDAQEPKLFLTVNTHGMPIEEQMMREELMHTTIRTNDRLYKATDYHCINVV